MTDFGFNGFRFQSTNPMLSHSEPMLTVSRSKTNHYDFLDDSLLKNKSTDSNERILSGISNKSVMSTSNIYDSDDALKSSLLVESSSNFNYYKRDKSDNLSSSLDQLNYDIEYYRTAKKSSFPKQMNKYFSPSLIICKYTWDFFPCQHSNN